MVSHSENDLEMVAFLQLGSMYAIYGNMDPINTPPMNVSINIPAPWILYGIYIYRYMGVSEHLGGQKKRYDGMMGNNHSTHRNCHFGM